MEIWKDIEGYEGLYQVSNEGRVKSIERTVIRGNGRPLLIKEAALELGFNASAISHCCYGGFYSNGKWVNFKQYKGYKWSFEPL